MKTFFWNLIRSSRNPAKVSLTLKSLFALAVSFGLLDQATSDTAIGATVEVIGAISALVSSIGIFWGLVRKLLPKKE